MKSKSFDSAELKIGSILLIMVHTSSYLLASKLNIVH